MAVVAFVPLFALLLELLYPRFLVVEHLLLSANLTALALVTFAVGAVVDLTVVDLVVFAFLGWHLVSAQRVIYGQVWWKVAWKSAVLLMGGMALSTVLGVAASLLMLYRL